MSEKLRNDSLFTLPPSAELIVNVVVVAPCACVCSEIVP